MIQKAKRTLAMLMAAVMLCGLLPVSAMATTTEQDPVDATTTPVVTEQPEATEQPAATETPAPSETVLPTEQPEETLPDEDTPTAGLPEEVVEPYALTYEELLASTAQQDQPFASDTLGSDNFRIPALVTLSDGTLVAAADARWDHTYDGKNVDTMVAVSDDNGQSWTTSLVNYFADTENKENDTAASFIDPALAVDSDDTVYLLVDAFPGGVNLIDATCKTGTGYDSNGNLILKKSDESEYNYYVGDFIDGFAPVVKKDGIETEYAVNERYDLYKKNENGEYVAENYRNDGNDGAYIADNVFYQNAEFTVYPTSYLWLVKSTDDGKTWSAPQILNPQVKGEDEVFYGVGPGRGLVAQNDTIYFSCYKYGLLGKYSQKSSLIYSEDNGKTWKRTDNLEDANGGFGAHWSSENQAVQLNDGTIRMFFRNDRGVMCYADLNGNTWGTPVKLEDTMASIGNQYICSDCQLSVIHYSQTIDGKEAILVSCPSTLDSRTTGKIFVFTVNADNSLTAAYSYQVNTGAFQYSCLTELSDGSIGILYENGAASIVYENIAIETIAPDAVIGNGEEESTSVTDTNDIPLDGTSVNLAENGEAKTISVKLSDGQTLSANSSNTNVVTASVTNNQVTLTPVGAGSTTVTLTVSSMSRAAGGTATATLNVTVTPASITGMGTVDLTVGKTTDRTISNADLSEASISYDPNGIASVTVDTESGTTPAGTYAVLGSTTASITSGNKYVIASGNSVLATSGTNLSSASMPSADTALDSSVLWTIEGNSSSGYTISQKINGTTYYLGYTEQTSGSIVGAQAHTYTLALTKTRTTWSWDSGNHRFFKNLVTQEHWFDPDEYDDYFFTWNSDSSSWQMTTSSSSLTLYTTEEKEIPGESYTNSILTFTGVAAGTTTVTIGNYRYTVNVSEKPPFDEDAYTIISNTGTDGVNENGEPYGSKGQEVEHLILTPGLTYDLDVNGASYVTWTSNNPGIASVSTSGIVTARQAGESLITVTITDQNGAVGYKYVYVTVLDIDPISSDYQTTTRQVELYVDEITNSTLYYHQNQENNSYLVEVQEHTVFYLKPTETWAITFFGAPDEGYALTYMSAENNRNTGYWYAIEAGGASSTFYQNSSSLQSKYNNGASVVQQMLTTAKSAGCDGGFWFSRGSTDDSEVIGLINVISEPLPTVKKEITSVTRDGQVISYHDGMAIYVSDVINYTITVERYACEYGITYSNATLEESLAPFNGGSKTKVITYDLNDGTGAKTFTYNASYTVSTNDINKKLTNTVTFTYNYEAEYSKGSMTAKAEAAATINVVAFEPADYVVDFGLPVVFDFTSQIDKTMGTIIFEKATSAQGATVRAQGQEVTYQLTEPLSGKDTVTVTLTTGAEISFDVYPATTVYYDASFVDGVDVSTTGMTVYQTASAVGSKDHYGYEAGYNDAGYSNSASGTLLNNETATFTFTGTGVDIYTNPTSNSCYVAVRIYKGEELVHLYVVDTAMEAGTNTTYTSVPDSAYNVPIVSELGLEYGTYTVKIQRVDPEKANVLGRNNVVLNGFRVYGTLANGADNGVYTQDNEASPTFTQLRDVLINTLWSTYSEKPADLDQQYDQVYDNPNIEGMTASIGDNLTADDAQDLLINGPKNEIYLTKDQELTITVPTSGDYQIGLKALDAESGTVSINNSETTVTNVDMFYEVTTNGTTITLTNTSNNNAMIAVTYLKKTVR